ncbi:cob(I)yrinic acid a,c-diamide adenosyltransferase [Vagococcus elongatus]|uniref:Corrinoid adenosyltransferase n=1 Tax=Vagococcus elongatus TaxID=180344 RepID=A0A430B5N2_9ENTE|nr:cob(I)yrinic acid a,c-diamide adenosyltransferase [Vagococcus elongatus]RSU15610.1 ATP:cob(I)alamin adenosyltransferase [Vagococcus elongatus]
MKLYTKGGDKGKTSIIGGKRVSKNNPRVRAYGTVDEANSFIGLVISSMSKEEMPELYEELSVIQQYLFDAGTDLATPAVAEKYRISKECVEWLEGRIDVYAGKVPPIEKFIIPGGHKISSQIHICRTIIRRAERETVDILSEEKINEQALKFLNRLSDFLFVAARYVNHFYGEQDIFYERSGKVFRN